MVIWVKSSENDVLSSYNVSNCDGGGAGRAIALPHFLKIIKSY